MADIYALPTFTNSVGSRLAWRDQNDVASPHDCHAIQTVSRRASRLRRARSRRGDMKGSTKEMGSVEAFA